MGRVAYGVSGRVDRLRGLGNSIVPWVAVRLFDIIKQVEQVENVFMDGMNSKGVLYGE